MIVCGTYPCGETSVVKMLSGHGCRCFGCEDVDFACGDVGIGSVDDGSGEGGKGEVGREAVC